MWNDGGVCLTLIIRFNALFFSILSALSDAYSVIRFGMMYTYWSRAH